MRVLITGARGQVGHELLRLAPKGYEVVGLGSTDLDITDSDQVASILEHFRAELIINAAAYTAVDKAESESERAYAVNRDGVANLAVAAEQMNIPLLHISTDYVFSGAARLPYSEADQTGPTGVYGASKLGGENVLAAHCSRHIVLRTSWVFGAHGNNFVKTMLRLGAEREELGVVADQYGCPTSAASIARALWALAKEYEANGKLRWGTYHFSGAPSCTWHGFAEAVFHEGVSRGLLQRAPKVNPISTSAYPTPAKRPAWSVLDCKKLREAHGIAPADWRDELGVMLDQLTKDDSINQANSKVVADLSAALELVVPANEPVTKTVANN